MQFIIFTLLLFIVHKSIDWSVMCNEMFAAFIVRITVCPEKSETAKYLAVATTNLEHI